MPQDKDKFMQQEKSNLIKIFGRSLLDGWISRGIQWRREFVAKNIHPDKFLEMPKSNEMLEEYHKLSPQARIQALNILIRRKYFGDIKIR
jgi:hypothetical protein